MVTNNKNKVPNVPNLRFPEFTEEWKILPFGKTITLQRGSSPRPIVKYITDSCDGVNWVKIGDMPVIGNTVTKTEQKITKIGAKKSRKVEVGDLILSNSMSFGKPYIMGIEGYIHDGWFVIRNYQDSYTRDFLSNLLISDAVQSQYKRIAAGGVVLNISSDLVNSVKVGVPPLQEQEKISAFLKLIDERITTQKKIIEKLQSLIVGLAQQLTVSGTITTIADCLECHSSTLQENNVAANGKYPVYGANGIVGYTDSYATSNDSILIIKDGSGVGTVLLVRGSYSIIGTLNYLTVKSGFYLPFLYYALMSFNFEPYKTGMAIPHIYFNDYSKAKIACPSYEEQVRIGTILSCIDTKLNIEKQILDSLMKQKTHLLYEMFI